MSNGKIYNYKKIEHIMLNSNEQIVYDTLKADGYTQEAAAAVMGVVGGESGFKTFKETSYRTTSNARIRQIFGSRVSAYSESALEALKQSDENFFNAVYGGMYGNAPNEGYKYVGRGFNGITFKGNYQAAQNCTGIPFVAQPELMEQPKYAAKALSCYFKVIKDIKDLEKAFQEAYRQNAGPGNSFAYYQASTNTVNVTGIPMKRKYTQDYYQKIGGSTTAKAALFFFCFDSSSGRILFSQKIQDKKEIENINSFLTTLNF